MGQKFQVAVLFALCCIVAGCENVWETELENNKRELKIVTSNDYVAAGTECWVSVSVGATIILTQKIENSKTYTFPNPPARADFHVFTWSATSKILNVSTFVGLTPDAFNLDNKTNLLSSIGSSSVTIPDASNFMRWGLSSPVGWTSTTNANTKTLSIPVYSNPEQLFVYLLPSDGSAPRFKYLQNAPLSGNSSFTMASLDVMTSYYDVTLPSNSFFSYYLSGYNTSIYTDFLQFNSNSFAQGLTGSFRLYYPTGIRSNFQTNFQITTGDYVYVYRKLGGLPSNPFQALPNITISSGSQLRGATTTASNYSSMERLIFFSDYVQPTTNVRVRWNYTKRPEATNTLIIPDFPADIQNKIGTVSVGNLPLTYVSYSDYTAGTATNYDSFIDLVVKKSEPFWDVVKEARTFIRYPTAKQPEIGLEPNLY